MKIVTFNVRFNTTEDGEFSFDHRKEEIIRRINEEQPDVIGFQEIRDEMQTWLEARLPDYMWVGHGRTAEFGGEHCPIIFRKDKFKMRAFECFWLSDTPNVPGSKYEEQGYHPRVCNMLCLYNIEEGKSFRVYNMHLCNKSPYARGKSLELVLAKIDASNATEVLPTFIMGDFNIEPHFEELAPIATRTDYTDVTSHFTHTYHGYFKEKPEKIDYIYINDKVKAQEVVIWESPEGVICLSDHYPISLVCEI